VKVAPGENWHRFGCKREKKKNLYSSPTRKTLARTLGLSNVFIESSVNKSRRKSSSVARRSLFVTDFTGDVICLYSSREHKGEENDEMSDARVAHPLNWHKS
jgi:hypothetical protein